MPKRVHPLSRAVYDVDSEGLVHVEDHGRAGVFTPAGDWVRGELRHCDPQLCGWLAGPQLPPELARLPKDLPAPKVGSAS